MKISVYFNLSEAFCLALNPLLYYLSPVNRVVTRVQSQIRAGINTHRWISLFIDWLGELLRCQSKDLRNQKQEQPHDYTQKSSNQSLSFFSEGTQPLQDIFFSPPRYRAAGEDCSSRSKTLWSNTESPIKESKEKERKKAECML